VVWCWVSCGFPLDWECVVGGRVGYFAFMAFYVCGGWGVFFSPIPSLGGCTRVGVCVCGGGFWRSSNFPHGPKSVFLPHYAVRRSTTTAHPSGYCPALPPRKGHLFPSPTSLPVSSAFPPDPYKMTSPAPLRSGPSRYARVPRR